MQESINEKDPKRVLVTNSILPTIASIASYAQGSFVIEPGVMREYVPLSLYCVPIYEQRKALDKDYSALRLDPNNNLRDWKNLAGLFGSFDHCPGDTLIASDNERFLIHGMEGSRLQYALGKFKLFWDPYWDNGSRTKCSGRHLVHQRYYNSRISFYLPTTSRTFVKQYLKKDAVRESGFLERCLIDYPSGRPFQISYPPFFSEKIRSLAKIKKFTDSLVSLAQFSISEQPPLSKVFYNGRLLLNIKKEEIQILRYSQHKAVALLASTPKKKAFYDTGRIFDNVIRLSGNIHAYHNAIEISKYFENRGCNSEELQVLVEYHLKKEKKNHSGETGEEKYLRVFEKLKEENNFVKIVNAPDQELIDLLTISSQAVELAYDVISQMFLGYRTWREQILK